MPSKCSADDSAMAHIPLIGGRGAASAREYPTTAIALSETSNSPRRFIAPHCIIPSLLSTRAPPLQHRLPLARLPAVNGRTPPDWARAATHGSASTMKPGFEPGISREITIEVTEAMCPAFEGVIVHRCYSTWSVAHHFELAARMVLADFLEENEEGVGGHVSVDHLAPCVVGRIVTVQATLAEVAREKNIRVWCDVTAHQGDRLIANGRQLQIVMNKEHLKRYIERS